MDAAARASVLLAHLEELDTPEAERLRERARVISGDDGFSPAEYIQLLHEVQRAARVAPRLVLGRPDLTAPVRVGGIEAQRRLGTWLRARGEGAGAPLARLSSAVRRDPRLIDETTDADRRLIDDAIWEGLISRDPEDRRDAALAELHLASATQDTDQEVPLSDQALDTLFDEFVESGEVADDTVGLFQQLDQSQLTDQLRALSDRLTGNDATIWQSLVEFGSALSPIGDADGAGSSSLSPAEAPAPEGVAEPVSEPPPEDGSDLLVFGLNGGISHEAAALRRGAPELTVVDDSEAGDDILEMEFAGAAHRFELATAEGQRAFLDVISQTFNVAPDGLESLGAALSQARPDSRDEIAELIVRFAEAEAGERTIGRMVLSGHSTGSSLWGDGNGELLWSTLGTLSDVFPGAAGQVQHVHIAACYNGTEHGVSVFTHMFPNLESLWAYHRKAPGAHAGAQQHLQAWEAATREGVIHPDAVARYRLHEQVIVWTREGEGSKDGIPGEIVEWDPALGQHAPRPVIVDPKPPASGASRRIGDVLRMIESAMGSGDAGAVAEHFPAYRETMEVFDRYLYAEEGADISAGRTEVRAAYDELQLTLARADLPADVRQELSDLRERMIALIYFHTVARGFVQEHREGLDALREALSAHGVSVPSSSVLGRMSRPEAVAAIYAVLDGVRALPETTPLPNLVRETLFRLEHGLLELDPALIPRSWIG